MPRNARPEGYSRRHRFAERGSFGPILRSPRKIRGALATLHAAPGRPGASRFGLALTRRLVPNSVDRNRVKRLAREAFRRHPVKAAGLDCVLSLRGRIDGVADAALAAEFAILLDRLDSADSR
ncbi:MAG TPA: ribonuclease P protein component [Usitatibacter sp.]|nr:ribonuclease P protein component [Usitatibacter sp.]